MNLVTPIAAARPTRLQLVSYSALKTSPTGAGFNNTPEERRWLAGDALPLAADSLADALAEALTHLPLHHKDVLAIREDRPEGAVVFLYVIKRKSTPRWVHRDHVPTKVYDFYADLVCMLPAGVLS